MNSNRDLEEQVSAFADGALPLAAHAEILTALRTPAARAAWDDFHYIGDVLRSTDMAGAVRPDFAARMAARLASEPSYLATSAPGLLVTTCSPDGLQAATRAQRLQRFVRPAAAAAAVLVLTVATVPRMVGNPFGDGAPVVALTKPETAAVVLRDPRIEEYLLAHQRFSPSVFSSAQFARSATFATQSVK
ncbi:MAG: sigma-E factor negative regulatory protein [Herminiimonas sp.]|nr:sigma-E factor negative regulatory protein [Herminiimonas sp.]